MQQGLKWILLLAALAAIFFVFESRRNQEQISTSSKSKKDLPRSSPKPIPLDSSRVRPEYVPIDRVFVGKLSQEKIAPIQKVWRDVIAAEGFKTVEFPFDRGHIQTPANGATGPQQGIWPDTTGTCRLEMELKDLVPSGKGRVSCFR